MKQKPGGNLNKKGIGSLFAIVVSHKKRLLPSKIAGSFTHGAFVLLSLTLRSLLVVLLLV